MHPLVGLLVGGRSLEDLNRENEETQEQNELLREVCAVLGCLGNEGGRGGGMHAAGAFLQCRSLTRQALATSRWVL